MPARPAFHGLRKAFLQEELEKYSDAVLNGTKDEFVKDVIRRYFKRFPPELPHDQEPTAEHLANVDDTLPDEEPDMPDAQDYPEDQKTYYALEEAWLKRRKEIDTRSGVSLFSLPSLPFLDSTCIIVGSGDDELRILAFPALEAVPVRVPAQA